VSDTAPAPAAPEELPLLLKRAMGATHAALETGLTNPAARLIAGSVLVAGQLIARSIDGLRAVVEDGLDNLQSILGSIADDTEKLEARSRRID
jgi:hypothetical protein